MFKNQLRSFRGRFVQFVFYISSYLQQIFLLINILNLVDMVQYIRKFVDALIRSRRCEIDSAMSIQIGGIQCLLLDIHVIVMFTLMMACSPRNSRRELHSKNTTHIVTKTRARFISPCLLDCDTFVRAFLIPLK